MIGVAGGFSDGLIGIKYFDQDNVLDKIDTFNQDDVSNKS